MTQNIIQLYSELLRQLEEKSAQQEIDLLSSILHQSYDRIKYELPDLMMILMMITILKTFLNATN